MGNIYKYLFLGGFSQIQQYHFHNKNQVDSFELSI